MVLRRRLQIIDELIKDKNAIAKLNYDWSIYSILRVYYTICCRIGFYNINNFELVFQFCNNDDNALSYFSFIIWEGYYMKDELKENIRNILIVMNDKFDNSQERDNKECNIIYSDDKIRNIIKSIVRRFELTQPLNINDAFYNLKKFFIKERSADSHSDFKRQIFQLVNGVEERDITSDIINNLIELCTNISKRLKYLGTNLEKIKDCIGYGDKIQYDNLFKDENSIYNNLYKIDSNCTVIIDSKKQILETNDIAKIKAFACEIDNFQTNFLLEDKPFVRYCKKYMVDLKTCIDNAKKAANSRYNQKKGLAVKLKINNILTDNMLVNIHSDLLEYALEEIFYNAAKYQNNTDTVISCSVSQSENIIELIISQNKGFISSDRVEGHGIDTTVKPIFVLFCGEDGICIDKRTKDRYDIKIIFNI